MPELECYQNIFRETWKQTSDKEVKFSKTDKIRSSPTFTIWSNQSWEILRGQQTVHYSIELSAKLRKVAQCSEKAPTRTFSYLKVHTSLMFSQKLYYVHFMGIFNKARRRKIWTLVWKDHKFGRSKHPWNLLLALWNFVLLTTLVHYQHYIDV